MVLIFQEVVAHAVRVIMVVLVKLMELVMAQAVVAVVLEV
jgi:hypothetical protein